jgi:hypothetical protein
VVCGRVPSYAAPVSARLVFGHASRDKIVALAAVDLDGKDTE